MQWDSVTTQTFSILGLSVEDSNGWYPGSRTDHPRSPDTRDREGTQTHKFRVSGDGPRSVPDIMFRRTSVVTRDVTPDKGVRFLSTLTRGISTFPEPRWLSSGGGSEVVYDEVVLVDPTDQRPRWDRSEPRIDLRRRSFGRTGRVGLRTNQKSIIGYSLAKPLYRGNGGTEGESRSVCTSSP